MNWHLIDAREGFAVHRDRWAALNQRIFDDHPLLDARFVGPLLQHFASPTTRLAILGDPTEPRGMMLVERNRIGLWSAFLPSQSQIAPVLLRREDAFALPELMRCLPGHTLAFDLLAQDPLYSCMSDVFDAGGGSPLVEVQPHVRTMSVCLAGAFDRYWAARARSLVKNIRRYGHRLEHDGVKFELEVATSPSEVVARVDEFGRLESSGWKAAGGTAVSPDNEQGRFYAAMMRAFADRGDALVYSLRHAGRIVACRLVVRSARMLVILKTTYDEGYGRYAPGRLLLRAVLQDMFARQPGSVVEFYTNATEDQLAWATADRVISNVRVYRSTVDRWAIESARAAMKLTRGVIGDRVRVDDGATGGRGARQPGHPESPAPTAERA